MAPRVLGSASGLTLITPLVAGWVDLLSLRTRPPIHALIVASRAVPLASVSGAHPIRPSTVSEESAALFVYIFILLACFPSCRRVGSLWGSLHFTKFDFLAGSFVVVLRCYTNIYIVDI